MVNKILWLYSILLFFILSAKAQTFKIAVSPEYEYILYDKHRDIPVNHRNTMKLICIYDNYGIQGYQLALSHNSPERLIIDSGKKLVLKLYNGEYLTLTSINKLTEADNTAYKEQVKIRYKSFIIYALSEKELNKLLRYKVFEYKQYINDGVFSRFNAGNVAEWRFNEVLEKQFKQISDNISPFKKKKKKGKPKTDVNTLYKEGRISYLEGDSLIKTDENIKFDIKWIE